MISSAIARSASAHAVVNALTVDVEDYFQVSAFDGILSRDQWADQESRVVASTEKLLQMFDDAGARATFFTLGWVAERYPALIRRIAEGGHEIASHGYGHRLVYDLTPGEFREDIRRSLGVIQAASGRRVSGYRAPSYSITMRSEWALDVLIEEGFTYDSSIYPIHHDRYGIPEAPRHIHQIRRPSGMLWELPGSTVRIAGTNLPIGGGGYFRLLPYAWTKWGIRQLNEIEQRPAVFYIHPWEVDPEQPRLPASLISRFRHYRNLSETEQRLRSLLSEFSFAPVKTVLETLPPLQAVNQWSPLNAAALSPQAP